MKPPHSDWTLDDPDTGRSAPPRDRPSQIGRYRLERALASGGMGEIWLAEDEQLRRRVALKLMHRDEDASRDRLDRFEHEAQTIARLQHPHVVQIFDYGTDQDGTPYIAMELLDGEDLARVLRRTRTMPLRALVPLVVQACKGLHAAHRAGIVHRDLKPANLFIARHGIEQSLKILDFGIAAVRHGPRVGAGQDDASLMVGTPSYMSPEQASGAPVDHRSDLWSLAVVAYEALTGVSPFSDATVLSMANRIIGLPHAPPSSHLSSLGPAVDGFFERALAKDRGDRFASALELAAAFSALVPHPEQQSVKLLVVDDELDLEDVVRQRFRRQVRSGEYELLFAHDGHEALEVLARRPDIDVVLTDLNMPGMDGLTLLDRLGRAGPALRAVVISAYGDMTNIRAAMNRGAYDFLTKPLDFADVQATVEKAVRDAKELRRALRSIEENDTLRLFVDDAVMERLLPLLRISSEVTAETLDATVACVDVCGVRARIEGGSAGAVFELLNRSFDVIVPIINTWGGAVVRFVGDAVLAVFQGDEHLLRACSACSAIRGALSEVANTPGAEAPEVGEVGIGLDTGPVLSGSIGSRTIQRLDYTVLGPVVSRALALEQRAAEGQILVDERVAERLAPLFQCRRVGEDDELGAIFNLERSRRLHDLGEGSTRPDELTPTLYVDRVE